MIKPANDPGEPEARFDARAVANLLLDKAAHRPGIVVTNLTLQKLLYFAHGLHLVRHERPLVDGYFEAWRHGPVHPAVYEAFKAAGREPIRQRARKRSLATGVSEQLPIPDDALVHAVLDEVLDRIGHLSARRLVDLSHAPGGPWDYTVNKADTFMGWGLRIPASVIRARFSQKTRVSLETLTGEPLDDSRLA